MKRFQAIEKARFLDRPNRFVVHCLLGRNKVRAYMPNPGKLMELLLPGSTLYLIRQSSSRVKIGYLVLAVEKEGYPVMLHTHYSNTVARHLIEHDRIAGLEGARVIQQEFTVGRSRFDFLLRRGDDTIILEVKSCTLFSHRTAMFPDAVTARGRKHLLELASLAENGMKTAVLFVVHSPTAEYFLPEYHTDLGFSTTLLSVSDRLMIRAVSVGWTEQLNLKKRVRNMPVPWDLIRRECHDRGSYLIILNLKRGRNIETRGGVYHCPKGYYIYVGSARESLSKRIERHRRKRKNLFWHIDYLRQHADFCDALPVRASHDLECEIATAMSNVAEWTVPGFGASDCTCPSHLFGMSDFPLRSPQFVRAVLHFRIDRLEKIIDAEGL
jgi:sugar fermentation stimulation protein A